MIVQNDPSIKQQQQFKTKQKKERKTTLDYKLGFEPSTIPEYCQIHVTIWFVTLSWRKTHSLFEVDDFPSTQSDILHKIIKIKQK